MKQFMQKLTLFLQLCKLDMQQRTAGTALGYLWLFIAPLVSIAVIWLVFNFGLKTNVVPDSTYSLLIGLMAWQFFADAIMSGINAFVEKPFLVKKIKFPLIFLPLIKIANAFRIHIPFILLIIIISVNSGHFSIANLLLFLLALPIVLIFLSCLILLLSTVVVFYRDTQSMIGVSIQLIFWATPIVWPLPENPKMIGLIERLNPFYFLVRIYRILFLKEVGFAMPDLAAFAIILISLVLVSRFVFLKMKDQFADVL